MYRLPASMQDALPSNLLLRHLAPDPRALILAECTRIQLRAGALTDAMRTTCFPEDAVLSLVSAAGLEFGLVGAEGMTGWSVLLGDAAPGVQGRVEVSGAALALPTTKLTALCRRSPAIRGMVLQAVEQLAAQMIAAIGAAASQPIRARLARRLLMLHDRSPGDGFELKHAQLAEALCVRRASVTDCLHLLEGEHVLRCRRNLIEILDRPLLERVAGAAYGPVERSARASGRDEGAVRSLGQPLLVVQGA